MPRKCVHGPAIAKMVEDSGSTKLSSKEVSEAIGCSRKLASRCMSLMENYPETIRDIKDGVKNVDAISRGLFSKKRHENCSMLKEFVNGII